MAIWFYRFSDEVGAIYCRLKQDELKVRQEVFLTDCANTRVHYLEELFELLLSEHFLNLQEEVSYLIAIHELISYQPFVHVKRKVFFGPDHMIRQKLTVDPSLCPFFLLLQLQLRRKLIDADVVEIVEVLTIEPSEDYQATAHKVSRVSSSGTRNLPIDFHCFDALSCRVEDQDILEVAAEPTAEDVHLTIEDSRGVSPACEERTVL